MGTKVDGCLCGRPKLLDVFMPCDMHVDVVERVVFESMCALKMIILLGAECQLQQPGINYVSQRN